MTTVEFDETRDCVHRFCSESRRIPTAIELLRTARQDSARDYGPCAAALPTVVAGRAQRDVELSDLPLASKTALLSELAALVGPNAGPFEG